LAGVSHGQNRQRPDALIDQLENRQIAARIGGMNVRIARLVARQADKYLARAFDDMEVGENQPFGIDDDPTAERLRDVCRIGEIERLAQSLTLLLPLWLQFELIQ